MMKTSSPRAILSGSVSDVDLASLIDASSLGRRALRLELIGPSGAVIGHVILKGGKIVSASAGAVNGLDALKRISSSNGAQARFRVVNADLQALPPEPIGVVSQFRDISKTGVYQTLPDDEKPPPASRVGKRVQMMEGSLEDFDLATLMQSVSLGRSGVELEIFDRADNLVGTVSVKSGKILSAHARELQGIGAIYELLESPSDFRFAVFRREVMSESMEAIGSVQDVLLGHATDSAPHRGTTPPPPPAHRTTRPPPPVAAATPAAVTAQSITTVRPPASVRSQIVILQGLVSDVDVASLLQTISLGRQIIEISLAHGDETLGMIRLKAGHVLSAVARSHTGVTAVAALLQAPAEARFTVTRLNDAVVSEPIGSIANVLMRAASEAPFEPTLLAASAPVTRTAIMEGTFADVDLGILLQTVGLSRTSTAIEVFADHALIATIYLKAGMLLDVEGQGPTAIDTLNELRRATSGRRFKVFRVNNAPLPSSALGSIGDLLARVAVSLPPPDTTEVIERVVLKEAAPPPNARIALVMEESVAQRRLGGVAWAGISIGVIALVGVLGFAAREIFRDAPVQALNSSPAVTISATPRAATSATPSGAPAAPAATAAATTATVAPPPVSAAVATAAPTPAPTQPLAKGVAQLQEALRGHGFDPGAVDNVWGPRTRAALIAFQRARGLPQTGTINPDTMLALGSKPVAPGLVTPPPATQENRRP